MITQNEKGMQKLLSTSNLEWMLRQQRVQWEGISRPVRITEILTYIVPRVHSLGSSWKVDRSAKTMIPGTTSCRVELSQKQAIAHQFGQNTSSSIRTWVRGIAFAREYARS